MAFVARFLGRRLAYAYEIVELVPGRRLVMRTAEGAASDGDHLDLGNRRGWQYTDDAPEPRRTGWVLEGRRSLQRGGDAAGQSQGPRSPEGAGRAGMTFQAVRFAIMAIPSHDPTRPEDARPAA
jgi:hypothetical protein